MNPDEISDQILYGLAPHDWVVFPPPKYPKIASILYSLYIIFMCPLLYTAYFGFMFMALGQTALIQSSFWPMYTTYPILALIALGTPFFCYGLSGDLKSGTEMFSSYYSQMALFNISPGQTKQAAFAGD